MESVFSVRKKLTACAQWIIPGSAKDMLNELNAATFLTAWDNEVRGYRQILAILPGKLMLPHRLTRFAN